MESFTQFVLASPIEVVSGDEVIPVISDGKTKQVTVANLASFLSGGSSVVEDANQVYAGPTSGGASEPTFRNLVLGDLPAIAAANLTDGTIGTGNIVLYSELSSLGDGTVTSVGMTVPSFLSVTPSVITTSGTFAMSLQTEIANKVFAGPSSGSAATPTFRALVANDIPTLNQNTSGNAATVTTNANLTGPITSTGNATAIAAQTGTGSTFAMSASPTLTGIPLAPTASVGTNTTQLATTAFVQAAPDKSFPNEASHFTGPSNTTTSHTYSAGSNTLQQQVVGVMLIVSTLSGGTAIVTVNWVDAGSNNRSVTMTPVNYASTVNITGDFPYPTITINPGSGTTITVTCTITGTISYYFTSWSCNVS